MGNTQVGQYTGEYGQYTGEYGQYTGGYGQYIGEYVWGTHRLGSIHVCECDQHTGHHVSECIECFLQRFRTLFRNFAII